MSKQQPKFYNTTEFQKLNAQWQKKLAKSGFKDSETFIEGESVLKQFHGSMFQWHCSSGSPVEAQHRYEAKKIYYEAATKFLQEHAFESDLDLQIWTRHADGMSVRQISEQLSKPRKPVPVTLTNSRIKRLRVLMKAGLANEQE